MKIRIGSRGSPLALWQAQWVQQKIQAHDSSCAVEIQIIKTTGDRVSHIPPHAINVKGLFTKEIEEALRDGRVDLAVHSLKDLPAELPPGLQLIAVPEREMPYDAFVGKSSRAGLLALPAGAVMGTSSLRRRSQLQHVRPDLKVVDLRGNVDTRLRKLEAGEMDGIILAAAGLRRLGLASRITEVISPDIMLPAIGQGALAIEARADDAALRSRLNFLNSKETATATTAERAFLLRLGGGCLVPIAGHAALQGPRLTIVGLVATADGSEIVRDTLSGSADEPETLGSRLAERLLQAGAQRILNSFVMR